MTAFEASAFNIECSNPRCLHSRTTTTQLMQISGSLVKCNLSVIYSLHVRWYCLHLSLVSQICRSLPLLTFCQVCNFTSVPWNASKGPYKARLFERGCINQHSCHAELLWTQRLNIILSTLHRESAISPKNSCLPPFFSCFWYPCHFFMFAAFIPMSTKDVGRYYFFKLHN